MKMCAGFVTYMQRCSANAAKQICTVQVFLITLKMEMFAEMLILCGISNWIMEKRTFCLVAL